MLDDMTATALVAARRQDFVREATSARLAREAAPRRFASSSSRLLHWLRSGQLGIGDVDQPTAPLTARCATC